MGSCFVVLRDKMNLKIWRPSDVGKSKKRPVQKENNCNNVCRVCQVNLKVTYGKCVAKACGNKFKPSASKEIVGVVLSESLKSFGTTVIASYIDSQSASNTCSCFNFIRPTYSTSHKTATESSVLLQKSLIRGTLRDNIKVVSFDSSKQTSFWTKL